MQNDLINIPYIAHESEVARQERTIKRLWILSILIFLAFVISNASWIVYESSFEEGTRYDVGFSFLLKNLIFKTS